MGGFCGFLLLGIPPFLRYNPQAPKYKPPQSLNLGGVGLHLSNVFVFWRPIRQSRRIARWGSSSSQARRTPSVRWRWRRWWCWARSPCFGRRGEKSKPLVLFKNRTRFPAFCFCTFVFVCLFLADFPEKIRIPFRMDMEGTQSETLRRSGG